ncbi:asparagine synthetase B [candidate division WOR-3 bacterium]|nr:asparagine synthetase B [candidate division WOR-3 bacterium]
MILLFYILSTSFLIPMDFSQSDHLRAYGVTYYALEKGIKVEWLLNYRDGSFLMDLNSEIEEVCKIRGVSYQVLDEGSVQSIYGTIEEENMERVELTVAPRIAVYVPPNNPPWDDAVRLALDYAKVPYDKIWDEEVMGGALSSYDWLHLHHEDFTGQYGKFYASFRNTHWFNEQVRLNELMAKKLGFKKVWQLKHRVARKIQEYVNGGGFLFAMCSATETIDIALASQGVDIVPLLDGDGFELNCQKKLDFSRTFAFKDFEVDLNPMRYRHSDIDVTPEARRRRERVYFELFNFSAKYDPIPTLLTQNHTISIKEFLGQTTGFRRNLIKNEVVSLGEIKGTEEVKYLYGDYGKGFFTFYGGHDPEDYAHLVGDPPTSLELYPNSPGYRLILNNILFPAAKSKRLKT